MHLAIIGSGHVGGGLARKWARKGHVLIFGARNPQDARLLELAQDTRATITSVPDCVRNADVVVFAMPYGALDQVLAQVGPLTGKLVIDCTNAVERGPGGLQLKFGHATSSSEELQKRLPDAKVFKSFNAQGAENLANPEYGGVKASNFYCGDDAAARRQVHQLVEDAGFEAIDAGPLRSARLLEPLMLLWINAAQALGTRDLAFKLLKR